MRSHLFEARAENAVSSCSCSPGVRLGAPKAARSGADPLHPCRRRSTVPGLCEWEEQQAGHRPVGHLEPPTHIPVARGKCRTERRIHGFDAPVRRRRGADHEQARDAAAGPAPLASEFGRQPGLAIDAGDRGLDVGNDRLDLDDEDHPGSRVIRENVVRTSFTSDGERRFDLDRPSMTGHKTTT
jgi:hypothetical protein